MYHAKVILAGKCSDPMELTNALVVGYVDPALEGHVITFACPPGQTLNGSNTSRCMGNGKWERDPRNVECTGTTVTVTTDTSLMTTMIGTCTYHVMMYKTSISELTIIIIICCTCLLSDLYLL